MKPIYILDTNIWLDWLVFQNDTLDELKAAWRNQSFEIIYTDEMLEEWMDVIGRAQFKLSTEQQTQKTADLEAIARRVETLGKPLNPIACKDKDDQIFIDTALMYGAVWLISKDKHLLMLKNRARKQSLLVGTVEDWLKSN